ncbi:hypothetical protein HOO68_03415 [Candidatus Gracilibacteria bacterium]|nr:hypothetical protein [Candidatus Gracilibacteria bacterium]
MEKVYVFISQGEVIFVSKRKLTNKELLDYVPFDSPKEIAQAFKDGEFEWKTEDFVGGIHWAAGPTGCAAHGREERPTASLPADQYANLIDDGLMFCCVQLPIVVV